jgi:ATP-binding cassette subfamily C (CFTR/MRP) protein 4
MTTGVISYSGYLFKMMMDTDNTMTSVQRLIEYKKLPPEGIFETEEKFIITKGLVQMKDLYMRYRQELDYALKNLNITFQAGMKTGVVGRTGAGKSSLIRVLLRLTNPSRGAIFIDGKDYLQIGLHDLRKQISVIPQSSILFSTSLRNNLDPFNEHSDQEIIEVLINTKLESIFDDSKSPNLDIEIHSDKVQLSEGQKQLMCLARAILRKNKIVMIDEATANVDNETDKCIQSHLEERFKDSTVIVIAHRLRTIVDSDWIIVMKGGMYVEEGNPRELIKIEKSKFLKMINHTGPEESEYLKSRLSS